MTGLRACVKCGSRCRSTIFCSTYSNRSISPSLSISFCTAARNCWNCAGDRCRRPGRARSTSGSLACVATAATSGSTRSGFLANRGGGRGGQLLELLAADRLRRRSAAAHRPACDAPSASRAAVCRLAGMESRNSLGVAQMRGGGSARCSAITACAAMTGGASPARPACARGTPGNGNGKGDGGASAGAAAAVRARPRRSRRRLREGAVEARVNGADAFCQRRMRGHQAEERFAHAVAEEHVADASAACAASSFEP